MPDFYLTTKVGFLPSYFNQLFFKPLGFSKMTSETKTSGMDNDAVFNQLQRYFQDRNRVREIILPPVIGGATIKTKEEKMVEVSCTCSTDTKS